MSRMALPYAPPFAFAREHLTLFNCCSPAALRAPCGHRRYLQRTTESKPVFDGLMD
jgi:hypothetical protein